MAALSSRAKFRLTEVYLNSTAKAHDHKFKNFVAFCVYASYSIHSITTEFLLAFLEFLTFNNISPANAIHHISAIKSTMSNLVLNISTFHDPMIKVFNRALMRSRPLNDQIKTIIDIPLLTQILQHCDRLYMGMVYTAAFLLSFFSFLRISNLVPHSIKTFDPLKQLARGDIIFANPDAHIIAKWTKLSKIEIKSNY